MTDTRVTQQYTEVAQYAGTSDTKLTQQYVEVTQYAGTSATRLFQQYVEVFIVNAVAGTFIDAPTATATTSAPAPTLRINATVSAPTAQVTATAPTPEILTRFIYPDPQGAPPADPDSFKDYSYANWPDVPQKLHQVLFERITLNVGITVWKAADGWHSKRTPSQDEIDLALPVANADLPGGEDGRYLFLGGHIYPVSSTVRAELIAAGFPVGQL